MFLSTFLDEPEFTDIVLGATLRDDLKLYHKEETDCFASIKDPKERCKAFPGRGPTGSRIYTGLKKAPTSFGFDFLVYAVKKQEDVVPPTAHAVAATSTQQQKKTSGKNKGK